MTGITKNILNQFLAIFIFSSNLIVSNISRPSVFENLFSVEINEETLIIESFETETKLGGGGTYCWRRKI